MDTHASRSGTTAKWGVDDRNGGRRQTRSWEVGFSILQRGGGGLRKPANMSSLNEHTRNLTQLESDELVCFHLFYKVVLPGQSHLRRNRPRRALFQTKLNNTSSPDSIEILAVGLFSEAPSVLEDGEPNWEEMWVQGTTTERGPRPAAGTRKRLDVGDRLSCEVLHVHHVFVVRSKQDL